MIFTRHSVLKRGCSVWDREAMPQEEFQSRLDAARREMARAGYEALVIYGDNYSFGDLCYLTHYFPKVRGGVAVVPSTGTISLLLNIGSRDVPFAKTLTWVEDVRASGQVGRDVAELLNEKGLTWAKVGFVDSGHGFPLPQLEEMKGALRDVEWRASHSLFREARLIKSARELAALRSAGRVLNEIGNGSSGLIKPGREEHEVIADIDRLARDKGVEDIRVLVGEKRLQPPGCKLTGRVKNHLAVYLAVQHDRYWVEAGRTYLLSNDPEALGAYRQAQEMVAKMAAHLKPGGVVATIDETARRELGEFYATASVYGFGNGIGLNQWEAPFFSDDEARQMGCTTGDTPMLQEGMTVALRVVLEVAGRLVLFGDSYEVTSSGPKSLLG
jgi:Xaa-Pro dipeptidase